MDERLLAVRAEIDAGSVSPHSLVLLFNTASDADHAGDIATLEQTLDLARAIAGMSGESLQAEAERLAAICEQSLTNAAPEPVTDLTEDRAGRTLGIDLASKPKNTGACLIAWLPGIARVEKLEDGVDDERLIALTTEATKVGLDVPFGWPDAFVEAVYAHHQFKPWPTYEDRELRLRRTDLFVWKRTQRQPLSVSTDKIALPAFRAARLMSGLEVDRTGAGKFVEVYPRAARDRFKLGGPRSLKELRGRAPWLQLGRKFAAKCGSSEHCFDALLASLVARASALERCERIPDADLESARREGWIALPLPDTLELLIAAKEPLVPE